MMRIRPETSPERLLVVLKAIENGYNDEEKLINLLSPSALTENTINELINLAVEIQLIERGDGNLSSSIEIDLENELEFSYKLCRLLYKDNDFVRIVRQISNNPVRYSGLTLDEFNTQLTIELNDISLSKENILGLRFWLDYLGFVYIVSKQPVRMIINLFNRIMYIFSIYKFHDHMPINLFIDELIMEHPELEGIFDKEKNEVKKSLTNPLFTMEKLGYLKLKNIPDSEHYIYFNDGKTRKTISEIEIVKGGVNVK